MIRVHHVSRRASGGLAMRVAFQPVKAGDPPAHGVIHGLEEGRECLTSMFPLPT
jgi:hypothetical protein